MWVALSSRSRASGNEDGEGAALDLSFHWTSSVSKSKTSKLFLAFLGDGSEMQFALPASASSASLPSAPSSPFRGIRPCAGNSLAADVTKDSASFGLLI
jgi:hypothetical protein